MAPQKVTPVIFFFYYYFFHYWESLYGTLHSLRRSLASPHISPLYFIGKMIEVTTKMVTIRWLVWAFNQVKNSIWPTTAEADNISEALNESFAINLIDAIILGVW